MYICIEEGCELSTTAQGVLYFERSTEHRWGYRRTKEAVFDSVLIRIQRDRRFCCFVDWQESIPKHHPHHHQGYIADNARRGYELSESDRCCGDFCCSQSSFAVVPSPCHFAPLECPKSMPATTTTMPFAFSTDVRE